jgi:LmbE family N-acetylglucosaminyl deacetylase
VVAALGDEAPSLLYVSMPPGAMRALVRAAGARGPAAGATPRASQGPAGSTPAENHGTATGSTASSGTAPTPVAAVLGIADPDAFGAMAPEPTLVLDVGRVAARKLRALRCHRSQVAGGVFDALDERDAPRVLGKEHYRHASVGARAPTFVDALFESTPPARPS